MGRAGADRARGGGTLRFGELRRRTGGVSDRMLAQTLRWLEADGLVVRRAYAGRAPHTDYTLTALGQEASVKVASLAEWIEANLPAMIDQSGSRRPPATPRDL